MTAQQDRRVWSAVRWRRAQALRQEGFTAQAIARSLGLTIAQVRDKFHNEAYAQRHRADHAEEDTAMAIAVARAYAAAARSLTAVICGDPPPGYSALDQKNAARHDPRIQIRADRHPAHAKGSGAARPHGQARRS